MSLVGQKIDRISIPLPDVFANMSEEELYGFLIKQSDDFKKHCAEVCLRGAVGGVSKQSVINNLAEKYGFVELSGVYVKPIVLNHIFTSFQNVIEKYGKPKSIISE